MHVVLLEAPISGAFGLYLLLAMGILTALGIPWLLIRRAMSNRTTKCIWSSLIIAVGITPMLFAGDKGGFVLPAVILVPVFIPNQPEYSFISIGLILLFWGVIFIIRSGVGMLRDYFSKSGATSHKRETSQTNNNN